MKKIFIDVETTGLDPVNDSITEVALLIGDYNCRFLCCPEKFPENYDETIGIKTGLTKEHLTTNGITESKLFQKLTKTLSAFVDRFDTKDKFIIYGYNPRFDVEFIRELFRRNKNNYYGAWFYQYPVDVASIAINDIVNTKRVEDYPKDENGKVSWKLENVCKVYGIDLTHSHSALHDIRATKALYERIEAP